MKKIIALLSCIATLFCLTSCEAFIDFFKVERFYYDFDEISKDMEKVEIIQLPHSGVIRSQIDDLEESEIEILKTLDRDESLALLEDLSRIQYVDGPFVYNGPPCLDETCIRVWYLDGTFEFFSGTITTLEWGWADMDEYWQLIDKYLEQ